MIMIIDSVASSTGAVDPSVVHNVGGQVVDLRQNGYEINSDHFIGHMIT